MLKQSDILFLKSLLRSSFEKSEEIMSGNKTIESSIGYVLLDASDIYVRCSDGPFVDALIYSCIELCLYRWGYYKTAECFLELSTKEKSRVFEETRGTALAV